MMYGDFNYAMTSRQSMFVADKSFHRTLCCQVIFGWKRGEAALYSAFSFWMFLVIMVHFTKPVNIKKHLHSYICAQSKPLLYLYVSSKQAFPK